MASASDYLEQAIINHFFRNSAVTGPTTIYAACFTVEPTDAGTGGTEVTGGSYARKLVTFAAPVGGIGKNSAALDFTGMPACTVVSVGLYSAITGGNYMGGRALSSPRTVAAGKTFTVRVNDLILTVT